LLFKKDRLNNFKKIDKEGVYIYIYFFKTQFQNIVSMKDGLYHENLFIAVSKFFPLNWHYKP
jgi:hypothetical protein